MLSFLTLAQVAPELMFMSGMLIIKVIQIKI
jgi:hypothetical protein